jgi:ATP-dependent Clp protease protease subunit
MLASLAGSPGRLAFRKVISVRSPLAPSLARPVVVARAMNISTRMWPDYSNKRRRRTRGTGGDDGDAPSAKAARANDDDEDTIALPFSFPKMSQPSTIYSHMNHVFFNDDVSPESAFALSRELRQQEMRLRMIALSIGTEPQPIYLHLTTNGGCIHSAFSIIDTINTIKLPVYTVVTGFVASAGTLISLAGERRFMAANAYMLIHELRSGMWGPMTNLEEEYANLQKIMSHISEYYTRRTTIKRKTLDKILKKDLIWDIEECIKRGLIDEQYNP